jgi:hypothetical protein
MIEISIYLYGKPEWEMDIDKITSEELKEHGKELNERLNKIATLITKLESNNWSRYGTLYDINFNKDISFDEAKEELTSLGIDPEKFNMRDETDF